MRLKLIPSLVLCTILSIAAAQSPGTGAKRLGLDESFEFVSYSKVAVSPDGKNVVIATERPDWKAQRYRDDLCREASFGESPPDLSGRCMLARSRSHTSGPAAREFGSAAVGSSCLLNGEAPIP